MEKFTFNLNNKIYSNNNNILIEIVNDLEKLMNNSKDNLIIKSLGNIINKMNYIINENKKNMELIRKDISSLYSQITKKIGNFDAINLKNQELIWIDGKYIGQVIDGKANGKGIWYGNSGSKYEGDWRNDLKDGKGTYYYNDGDKYEGDFRNGLRDGKGIYYFNNGIRYEGDWRNGEKDGNGIFYFPNGERMVGDFSNGKATGLHVTITKNGEIRKAFF